MSQLDSPARPTAEPAPQHRLGLLARIASFAFRRRWTVVAAWVVALVATTALSSAFAGEFKADYTAPGSDSRAATELLADRFPARSGDVIDVVVHSDGPATEPATRAAVGDLLGRIAAVEHVRSAPDPYTTPGGIAPDGRTVVSRVLLDVDNPVDMPIERAEEILALAEAAERPGLDVALGGQAIGQAEQGEIGSEMIGLIAAAIILLLMFGSVVAAGLPIVVAIIGLGVSSALVGLTAAVLDVPDWSTSLAAMMGIGVGIDYVLLMVTRYREFLGQGLEPGAATTATVDTAGRSVLVAGTTVVISLLGLAATGLTAMRGAAVVTIFAVVLVMAAALTLLPALLSLLGRRIDRLRLPGVTSTARAARGHGSRGAGSCSAAPGPRRSSGSRSCSASLRRCWACASGSPTPATTRRRRRRGRRTTCSRAVSARARTARCYWRPSSRPTATAVPWTPCPSASGRHRASRR
jgi:RND superfamily putative drug exporter